MLPVDLSRGFLFAIVETDSAKVSALLKNGADPNGLLQIPPTMDGIAGLRCVASTKHQYDSYGRVRNAVVEAARTYSTTPMNIAVFAAFKAMTLDVGTDDASAQAVKNPLEIIESLLANGAHTTQKAPIQVDLMGGLVNLAPMDAYELACHLRHHVGRHNYDAADKVELMLEADRVRRARAVNDEDVKNKKRRVDCGPGKALCVDKLDTLRALRTDSRLADVLFQCTDKVELPAHKAICAAKSPYFAELFLPKPLPPASVPVPLPTNSHAMQHVLDHVYLSSLPSADDLGEYSTHVLIAASNFLLPDLAVHCFELGAETVSPAMFKTLLVLASAHDAMKPLKDALFELARKDPSAVLANAEVIALGTESPELWRELVSSLRPSDPASNVVASNARR